MSIVLGLSGNSTELENHFFPAIDLAGEWEICLLSLITTNSACNIVEGRNNLLHLDSRVLKIPQGSYELVDLNNYISKQVNNEKVKVEFKANLNTLQTELYTTNTIHFEAENSIGELLGFSKRKLKANKHHLSDIPVQIFNVNAVRLTCDIAKGFFVNGLQSRTIYETSIDVPIGYKWIKTPENLIYFKVDTEQLTSIKIKLTDQDGNLINLRNEKVNISLHLRKKS